jgi:hypothetical protein
MKLYKVEVQYTTYVVAESVRAAKREGVSRDAMSDVDEINCDLVHATEVTDIATVPDEWKDSYPFGAFAAHTCAEILAATDSPQ